MAKTKRKKTGRVTDTFNTLKIDNINLTKDLYLAAGIIDKQQAEIKSRDEQIKRLKKRLQLVDDTFINEEE